MYTLFRLLIVLTFIPAAYATDCKLEGRILRKYNENNGDKFARILNRKSQYKSPDCRGKLLLKSIKENKKDITRALLAKGTNVDITIGDGPTLLVKAIKENDYSMAKKLLEAGADANQTIMTKVGERKLIDQVAANIQGLYVMLLKKYGATETRDCTIKYRLNPNCYHKRDKPVLNISLVHYGSKMDLAHLTKIEKLLKERFYLATQQNISLNIISKTIIPLNKSLPSDFRVEGITKKDQLLRIWYYENVGGKVLNEIYDEFKKVSSIDELETVDAVLATTEAQFDGLALASGRFSVTEYPGENGWSNGDGGNTSYMNDYEIVDKFIHELGHNMFLGHTSTQCQRAGLTYEQTQECCAQSPTQNDVLSYCRNRSAVNENFMHKFEACNIEMIEDLIVPAMLNGGDWKVAPRQNCL